MHDVAAGRPPVGPRPSHAVCWSRAAPWRRRSHRRTARCDLHLCRALGPSYRQPSTGIVKFAERQRERLLSDDEYRQLGNALLMVAPEGLEARHRCDAVDDHNRMAPWRRAGPAQVGDRSATANGSTGRCRDRCITAAIVRMQPVA
jgi:hypothetical protein